MELKLVSERDNPLFGRREMVYSAASSPTPPVEKVAQAVAIEAKCAKECVVIDRVEQKFGQRRVRVVAKVYSSAEDAKRYERAYKFARVERDSKKKEAKPAA